MLDGIQNIIDEACVGHNGPSGLYVIGPSGKVMNLRTKKENKFIKIRGMAVEEEMAEHVQINTCEIEEEDQLNEIELELVEETAYEMMPIGMCDSEEEQKECDIRDDLIELREVLQNQLREEERGLKGSLDGTRKAVELMQKVLSLKGTAFDEAERIWQSIPFEEDQCIMAIDYNQEAKRKLLKRYWWNREQLQRLFDELKQDDGIKQNKMILAVILNTILVEGICDGCIISQKGVEEQERYKVHRAEYGFTNNVTIYKDITYHLIKQNALTDMDKETNVLRDLKSIVEVTRIEVSEEVFNDNYDKHALLKAFTREMNRIKTACGKEKILIQKMLNKQLLSTDEELWKQFDIVQDGT
eukprot:322338_1